ncbi:MAG: hypothetical protein DRN04_08655 [Thermoprotei archaeon]|nr:MAG: hypothetical protein DRN04_08655 [Thermoprotei archaeon]
MLVLTYLQAAIPQPQIWSQGQWMLVKTDEISVMFPTGGRKPIFIWWRTGDNATIYVVHFKGIWEYFVLNISEPRVFRNKYRFEYRLVNETFVKPVLEKLANKTKALKNTENKLKEYIDKLDEIKANLTKIMNLIHEIKNKQLQCNKTESEVIKECEKICQHAETIRRCIEDYKRNMSILENFALIKHVRLSDYINPLSEYIDELNESIKEVLDFATKVKEKKVWEALKEFSEVEIKVNYMLSKCTEIKQTSMSLHNMLSRQHMQDLTAYSQKILNVNSILEDLLAKISETIVKIKQYKYELMQLNESITQAKKSIMKQTKLALYIEEVLGSSLTTELGKWSKELPEINSELNLSLELRLNIKTALSELNQTLDFKLEKNISTSEGDVQSCLINITACKNKLEEVRNKVISCLKEKEEELKKAQELCHEIYAKWRSPLLPFDSCTWRLVGIKEIKAGDKTIGVTFTYVLDRVNIPEYKFAEDNILIRCRVYTVTVEEQVGGLNYTVSRAELKIDFIIRKWIWLSELLTGNFSKLFNATISPENEGLALWITAASINYTIAAKRGLSIVDAALTKQSNLVASSSVVVSEKGASTKLSVKGWDNDTKVLTAPRIPNLVVKVNFASEAGVLEGFIKYIASAKVSYSNGTVKIVPVSTSYMSAGGFFMVFFCYPYFNNGSLEHDPSIGVVTKEEKPKYTVLVANESTKVVSQETEVSTEEKITEFLKSSNIKTTVTIVLLATIIAVLILLILKSRRTINNI